MTRHDVHWALEPVDDRNFVGAGRVALLAGSADGRSLKVYYVEFEPGARTNWHLHTGTQILLVREGRCRYQREGEPALELGPGDTVTIPPGERHWHGAAPGSGTAHIAINLDATTEWMEPVGEAEYRGPDAGAA
jgi:quercetin dioxygenase-like cupin family protein